MILYNDVKHIYVYNYYLGCIIAVLHGHGAKMENIWHAKN